MIDNDSTWNVTGGMDVVGSDDEKVGEVADAHGEYVVVSKGFFFPTDYYIPTSAISNVDDKVSLNVTKDEALNQGWDAVPETTTTTDAMGYEDRPVDAGLNVENPVPAGAVDTSGYDDNRASTERDARETVNVPLTEEELTERTHNVERGTGAPDDANSKRPG